MKEATDRPAHSLTGEVYLRRSRALGDPDDPELVAQLLAHHRAALLRLAEADGVTVPPANIHQEIGSAERITGRPVFSRLLDQWGRLPPGHGGVLYVTEVSRLSRGSSAEWGRIEETLRRAGIKVRTRGRLFDLNNPEDCNYLEIEALFGRMELRYMKMRADAKRVEMVRDGLVRTGAAPWGYVWDKLTKELRPHPERFPLLQRLCREILVTSAHRLAQEYGIPQSSLLWTLSNPAICGWPAQRYSSGTAARRGSAARLPRDQWTWPERPGAYPPACTRAEWELIQEALARRSRHRPHPGPAGAWCRDVVRFVGFTGRVTLGAVRPPGRPGYESYDLPLSGRPRLSIERRLVHQAAEAALTRVFTDPAFLLTAWAQYEEETRHAAPRDPASGRDTETIRRALARERARLAGLKGEEWNPDLDAEALLANRSAQEQVRHGIERLKRELQEAESQSARIPALEQVRDHVPALAGAWAPIWEKSDEDLRRAVVNACLDAVQVVIDPERSRRPIYREVVGVTYKAWLVGIIEPGVEL